MHFQKDGLTPVSLVAASLLAVNHCQRVNSQAPEIAIYFILAT